MDLNVALDILKVAVGLVYLYLEYYAKRGLWIASVIMPAIGIWLFFNKGLYADCAINFYYLAIAVYGWWVWRGNARRPAKVKETGKEEKSAGLKISHIPVKTALALAGVWLALWALIALLLRSFTDSTVVWLDSFTTSLSFVGMWMLARKYIEQWLVWFVVDAVYVYLYWYKGIYFSGTLYGFYTVMALLGYRKWTKESKMSESKAAGSEREA